jgi:hypothetical protein
VRSPASAMAVRCGLLCVLHAVARVYRYRACPVQSLECQRTAHAPNKAPAPMAILRAAAARKIGFGGP